MRLQIADRLVHADAQRPTDARLLVIRAVGEALARKNLTLVAPYASPETVSRARAAIAAPSP